jgi:hypothetical protein
MWDENFYLVHNSTGFFQELYLILSGNVLLGRLSLFVSFLQQNQERHGRIFLSV